MRAFPELLLWSIIASALAPSCALGADDGVSIRLTHDSPEEKSTQQQLQRLLHEFDLSRWTVTHAIAIDEDAIPHSHPVLTLHTRHRKDDELLLSTYVHEQMHWFLAAHPQEAQAAVAELRTVYPSIPVGYPQGSADEDGNYEHLMVVYLEYRAGQSLLGELKARAVMQFWSDDHYTWIYREILRQPEAVGKIVKAHGLVPPASKK